MYIYIYIHLVLGQTGSLRERPGKGYANNHMSQQPARAKRKKTAKTDCPKHQYSCNARRGCHPSCCWPNRPAYIHVYLHIHIHMSTYLILGMWISVVRVCLTWGIFIKMQFVWENKNGFGFWVARVLDKPDTWNETNLVGQNWFSIVAYIHMLKLTNKFCKTYTTFWRVVPAATTWCIGTPFVKIWYPIIRL